ncbi:hypothetical protein HXX76_001136 [Chlamydomonas incerta]|uniref:Uncharacterized protein n=1 Tax=Chlamydomonas incerta TaxID=51695 RepID=A0A836B0R0_CHLIN|nr:hypothetical protein HXX76_001136 [Chlamydomonas incerta]|eukprot:KAG2444380.1 hypothetical protein HXX76_001136 [Chlamydomonas incerta]
MRAIAVAALLAVAVLLLLAPGPSAATSSSRDQARPPSPARYGKSDGSGGRPPVGNEDKGGMGDKGGSGWPSPPAYPPTISVAGVDILNPKDVQQYRRAHVTYWRTVLSKPAGSSPANPNPPNPPANFACPKATDFDRAYGYEQDGPMGVRKGGKDGKDGKDKAMPADTYLITGSISGSNTTFPIRRSCTLPVGRRVILNIYNDFEWYSPPLDYSLTGLMPPGVRLSPASISSLAQASSAVNASRCVFATINGTRVPDIAKFYQASPFVPDMDISAGFYQLLRDVAGFNLNGTAAARLYRNGINNTDFADAGYYLVFPRGLPRGRHAVRFGILPNCTTLATSFFREGTQCDDSQHQDRKDDGGRMPDGGDRKDKAAGGKGGKGGRPQDGGKDGRMGGKPQDGGKDGCKDGYPPMMSMMMKKDECKCWPFPESCGTDCLPQAAGTKTAFSWEYVITVDNLLDGRTSFPPLSVAGVQIVDPRDSPQYRQAHVTYWRTVLSKPAVASPLNPNPTNPPPNFACPKATDFDLALDGRGKTSKDTYLITHPFFGGANDPNRFEFTCTLPANRRIILDVFSYTEWYAPPIDYTLLDPQFNITAGVRLSPDALSSLAQANVVLANASQCLFVSINGVDVPRVGAHYHVSPFVPDMDIDAGFFQILLDLNPELIRPVRNSRAAQDLLLTGIKKTDFADAGYFVIFPRGLPRGTHNITFGVRPNCRIINRTFFRKGTRGGFHTISQDGGRKIGGAVSSSFYGFPAWWHDGGYLQKEGVCWPNAVSCATDCQTLPDDPSPAGTFSYRINVKK